MAGRLQRPSYVKVLRENGLVRAERKSGRLRLSADPAAVESLLGELRAAVLQEPLPNPAAPAGASTTGSDRIPATVVESTRSTEPVTA